MNQGFAIILDPREEGREPDMSLRGKVCYLDSLDSTGLVFVYVDQDRRWSQECDPAWERANSDYPNVRTPGDAAEDVRYELGLFEWRTQDTTCEKAFRFIDISGNYMDVLDQIENDLNVKLDRQAIVSDVGVLWSYIQRAGQERPEAVNR